MYRKAHFRINNLQNYIRYTKYLRENDNKYDTATLQSHNYFYSTEYKRANICREDGSNIFSGHLKLILTYHPNTGWVFFPIVTRINYD